MTRIAFGYRNVTQNGVDKLVSANRIKAEAKIAELHIAHPGIVFELVTFTRRDETVTVWKTGTGRAGNSYPVKATSTRWIARR